MITDVAGVRVGHWTDEAASTGCTVVLLPAGTVASGEVRGGAPATREWALLAPGMLVSHISAVVLTGGSAFGLASADGVMRWCEERGVGFPTAAGPVPIVIGLGLYDLGVGDAGVRPGPDEGYAACRAATPGPFATGRVGAGAGATVGKFRGPEHTRPGGIGTAVVTDGPLTAAALVAVNAVGDLLPADGEAPAVPSSRISSADVGFGQNTTIGVIATNARLDKLECYRLAAGGHDGYARALSPVHTSLDGDAVVACATGEVAAQADHVRFLGAAAMEAAIRIALTA